MFDELETIYARPKPFEFYTAEELWTDEHTSAQMLAYHLDEEVDVSSRSGAFIDRSVEWIVAHFGLGEHGRIQRVEIEWSTGERSELQGDFFALNNLKCFFDLEFIHQDKG